MIHVRLLGRPGVLADGAEVPGPRGNKTWGLLAYLVGSGASIPRERLVSLLFPDAEDGLAALRWNLAQLRRCVGGPKSFTGDPVMLGLGAGTTIDVQLLAAAPWYEVMDHVAVGEPLLSGLTFPSCAGFELWLDGERRRVAALAATALREAARAETASGRPGEAARHARRLVALEPWDENAHELLVRARPGRRRRRGAGPRRARD